MEKTVIFFNFEASDHSAKWRMPVIAVQYYVICS
jgi:hypothetical protein